MSIGSFLATAGLAGQSMRAEEAAMREAQQQQLAIEALNRQELARREVNALPPAALAAPDFKLGAPLQVIEPEVVKAPAVAAAPAAAPAATGGTQTAGVKTDTAPAPATKVGTYQRTAAGVVIPRYDSRKKDRLNTGVGGFLKENPNDSDIDKTYVRNTNAYNLDRRLEKIEASLAPSLGFVRKPFAKQDVKADLVARERASAWFVSDNAKEYFRRNPEMVAVAEKKPFDFFKGLMGYNEAAPKGGRWIGSAAPKPAAKKADAAPVEAGGSYANVPFAQVKNTLISKEGPASLGGYNAIAYNTSPTKNAAGVPQPSKPLTSMNMVEVLKFQREVMRPKTRGRRGAKDVGSTGVGAYQFESDTLAENAKLTFGKGWEAKPFSPENQDKIAETLYNRVRGDRNKLNNTWFAFKDGGTAPSAATGGAPSQSAGVQVAGAATESPIPVRIDPSKFYLREPDAVSRDMQVALQKRTRLAQMAGAYQRSGMGAEYMQATLAVEEMDNSLAFLQGMQGIQELGIARDPRRLAAVWSYYTGVPVQLQPQTDGTYNVMVNGQVTQRGVKSGTIIDAARSSFDAEYRNAQAASASTMALKQFESSLKISEQAAKTLGEFTSAIQQEKLKGANAVALKELEIGLKDELERQNPEAKVTMTGDGTGSAILSYKDGRVATFTPGGEIEINGQTVKTAPTVRAVGVGN